MAATKTQGTQLYYASAATTVTNVAPVISMTGIDSGAVDQIDTTLLTATARSFVAGLANPGAITVELLFDPLDTSLQAFVALKESGASKSWCIGLSDGTTAPTAAASVIVQPAAASRSSVKFDGFVSGLVVDAPSNDVVKATATIQTSGNHAWVYHT
jgi:hypothetical protein